MSKSSPLDEKIQNYEMNIVDRVLAPLLILDAVRSVWSPSRDYYQTIHEQPRSSALTESVEKVSAFARLVVQKVPHRADKVRLA